MPAKQLCPGSEHSSLDPPGHGSQTRLALDAEWPQKNLWWLAFPSSCPGMTMPPSYPGQLAGSTSCQYVHIPRASSKSWLGQQAMTPLPPEMPVGFDDDDPPPRTTPSEQ